LFLSFYSQIESLISAKDKTGTWVWSGLVSTVLLLSVRAVWFTYEDLI